MEDGEIQVTDEERERDEHQPVVEHDGAREVKARVALAVPEQEPGGEEEDRERGHEDRVDLLSDVQPVMLEALELARRAQQSATVAEHHDGGEQRDPSDATPEMHDLDERTARDENGQV